MSIFTRKKPATPTLAERHKSIAEDVELALGSFHSLVDRLERAVEAHDEIADEAIAEIDKLSAVVDDAKDAAFAAAKSASAFRELLGLSS